MTPEYPIYLCLRLSRHRGSYCDIYKHDHPVHLSNRTYLRDSLIHDPSRRYPMAHGKPVFPRWNASCSELLGITPLWEGFEMVLHHLSRSRNLEGFVREFALPSSIWTIPHRLFRARIRAVRAIGPVVDDAASTNCVTRQCSLRWMRQGGSSPCRWEVARCVPVAPPVCIV